MEHTEYLIDTNAVIDYLGKKMNDKSMLFMSSIIDNVPVISVITKIEVLGFDAPPEHYKLLSNFMNDATVLGLSDSIIDLTIELRKKYKTKLPDTIIAATALAYDLVLVTRNESDFKNINAMRMLNPYTIGDDV